MDVCDAALSKTASKAILSQATPSRLDRLSYESLRQQILRRDGWRCQSCGTMSNLEVHHREFRSHSGPDFEDNLITLCTACQSALPLRPHTLVGALI